MYKLLGRNLRRKAKLTCSVTPNFRVVSGLCSRLLLKRQLQILSLQTAHFTMAKNTGASKFRKVDVDQYDDDKFDDENEADVDSSDSQGANDTEVNNLLAQGKNLDALKLVLASAPVASKNQVVKDCATNTVVRVMTSFKTAEIEKSVKSLNAKEVDMLMKYIYRGFEFPSEGSSAVLLTWHEKTFAQGGSGCIVRVLTDRKRV